MDLKTGKVYNLDVEGDRKQLEIDKELAARAGRTVEIVPVHCKECAALEHRQRFVTASACTNRRVSPEERKSKRAMARRSRRKNRHG